MRKVTFLSLVLVLSCSLCGAQVREKLPAFPLPAKGLSQRTWKQKRWPSQVKELLQRQFQCKRCNTLVVRRVSLGVLRTGAIVDQPDNPCEAQAGACSNVTILYRADGRYRLQDIVARSSVILVRGQGGVPDVVGVEDFPCCSGHADRYSYDPRQKRFVDSGCDEIEYDNFGNFKGAAIKPCNT